MGFFGKSKKEKEEEQRQQERIAKERAVERQNYDELVRAIQKVKSMDPTWTVYAATRSFTKDPLNLGKGGATYETKDGIRVTIKLQYTDSNNCSSKDEVELRIEKAHEGSYVLIFYRCCYPQSNDFYELRQDAWTQLNDYAKTILMSKLREQYEQEQARKLAEEQNRQRLKDEFFKD